MLVFPGISKIYTVLLLYEYTPRNSRLCFALSHGSSSSGEEPIDGQQNYSIARAQQNIRSSIFSSQCLSLGRAIWIQVRLLANTNRPVAESISKTFIVKCGSVERTSVIPNS
jgi:hypothetical protein